MKFNKISMVLAALAFVGCSSEDLNEFAATPAVEDSNLIQLGSDFVLAGVSAEGTTTRTHWTPVKIDGKDAVDNIFLPIWKTAPNGTSTIADNANLTAEAIGLCWLGNGATGTDVYTNYEFYHFGWLNKGEDKATFECGGLTNGSLYDEITVNTGDAAGAEADPTKFVIPGKSLKAGVDNLEYNSGIYKTENKAIFGGQYIVYYPYNPNFKDAGTIPATAVINWPSVPMALNAPALGAATFRYSAPTTIEGGSQAANFTFKNLSALVRLKIAAPKGNLAIGETIDKIVLFSAKKQLLKQANLAADKIAAGNEGTELYASTEGTKTIVANSNFALQGANVTPLNSPYITVLPTTVDDLVVFVHNSSAGKWARVNLGKTEFKQKSAQVLTITVGKDDFTNDFIAVDQTSLETALTEANPLAASKPQTITVIGDIALNSNLAIDNVAPLNLANSANITIKGDDIIVPEDVTLTLNTKMESNVRVLGKSCCSGTTGGRLYVNGGTISNVTLEKTEAKVNSQTDYDNYNPELGYYGAATATVAAGKTVDVQAGNVIVNQAVQHKGDIKIAKDVKLTVNAGGDLNFMGSNVTNDGTIEVEKGGKYDMTDANGNATATDGQRMTNNGKFIHNVDAGVGTAVQSMVQNGEYRCRVDDQIKLSDAYQQWLACSVIEMVNATPVSYNLVAAKDNIAYKHNGKYIDIEVNSTAPTTFDNPSTSANGDSESIQIGNLTVTAGGLTIDFVKGTGKRSLTVNGDMNVADDTEITDSKKITVTGNLTVEGTGKTLTYKGAKANVDGLAVTKDIKVSGATFDADEVDALNITCANFYLEKSATAKFGNRTDGAAKNLVVSGTISNPATCTFNIHAANQNGAGSVLAWVTCKKLEVGGNFSAARPRVVE